MQIFYHVTRDIDLPRAGRRSQPAPESGVCEACGRRLAPDAARAGAAGANGTSGLAFCGECRERMKASAHQIHFCDACGVSLPIGAVQGGEALAKDGRILCPACLRADSAVSRRLVLIVVLALAAAVSGIVLAQLL